MKKTLKPMIVKNALLKSLRQYYRAVKPHSFSCLKLDLAVKCYYPCIVHLFTTQLEVGIKRHLWFIV